MTPPLPPLPIVKYYRLAGSNCSLKSKSTFTLFTSVDIVAGASLAVYLIFAFTLSPLSILSILGLSILGIEMKFKLPAIRVLDITSCNRQGQFGCFLYLFLLHTCLPSAIPRPLLCPTV